MLDHIGIACRNANETVRLYTVVLGGKTILEKVHEPMKLKIIKIDLGNTVIELLEPKDGETVVQKFLSEKGEGIHHICFKVKDLKLSMKEFLLKGYKPLWDQPRIGASGKFVNFFHPKQTNGTLIEITE